MTNIDLFTCENGETRCWSSYSIITNELIRGCSSANLTETGCVTDNQNGMICRKSKILKCPFRHWFKTWTPENICWMGTVQVCLWIPGRSERSPGFCKRQKVVIKLHFLFETDMIVIQMDATLINLMVKQSIQGQMIWIQIQQGRIIHFLKFYFGS